MNTKQKIHFLIWITPLLGIVAEVLALSEFRFTSLPAFFMQLIVCFTPAVFLHSGSTFGWVEYHSGNALISNYLSVALYSSMLLAAILYTTSKGREMRLLRSAFSIMILVKIIMIVNMMIRLLADDWSQVFAYAEDFVLIPLGFITNGIWAFIAWYVVRILNADRTLAVSTSTNRGEYLTPHKYISTPKWQRFAHVILDMFFSVAICMGIVTTLCRICSLHLLQWVGEESAIYLMMALCRLLYYIFYESIFSATPAKYITETRVLSSDGSTLKPKGAVLRTLGRYIPFDALSYFGYTGWHDQCGDTIVVKEERTGVKASNYLWFIPILMLLAALAYVGKQKYNDYKWEQYEQSKYEQGVKSIENQLTHLSLNTVLELSNNVSNYYNNVTCLKVTAMKGDSITFQILKLKRQYIEVDQVALVQLFRQSVDSARYSTLHRDMINRGYVKEYEQYKKQSYGALMLNGEDTSYTIVKAYRINNPNIVTTNGSYGNGHVNVGFKNKGTPADIIGVEVLHGKTSWIDPLPMHMDDDGSYFSIRLDTKEDPLYKISMTLQDSTRRQFKYMLNGEDERTEFLEVFEMKE